MPSTQKIGAATAQVPLYFSCQTPHSTMSVVSCMGLHTSLPHSKADEP